VSTVSWEAERVEHRNFDRIVRSMASGVSRRSVLRRAAGSAIATPMALLGFGAAEADGKDNKNKKDKDKDKERGSARGSQVDLSSVPSVCGDVGSPCFGGGECCGGLECHLTAGVCVPQAVGIPTGSTQTNQTVMTSNQVCAGDCDQTTQQAVGGPITQTVLTDNAQLFGRPPSYWVDVACQFDAPAYRTICTATGHGNEGAPRVHKITLPGSEICALVISEETREEERRREVIRTGGGGSNEANAGTGGVASADASGGSVSIGDVRGDNDIAIDASGGTANADASGGDNNVAIAGGGQVSVQEVEQVVAPSKLTLTLEGHVVPGRPATYWLDTDTGRRPASGPALVQVADETADVGAIVVEARSCAIPQAQQGFDWFGQCTAPATGQAFSLYPEGGETTPLATTPANEQGRVRFGNLAPGTYTLRPEGTVWCYAESDRVDANGNVTVESGLESHVWSFTCGAPAGS
jgi:hypothetical protein